MVTFMDGASRHTTAKLMKHKKVAGEWKQFKAQFENQNNVKIKALHRDNGGEYVNNELSRILEESGIEFVKTVPFNPKSNGIAEKLNRTLFNTVRVLLPQENLSNELWVEAVLHATFLHNRIATRALDGRTPFEASFGRLPNMTGIKVFGCLAFGNNPHEISKKLDSRTKQMILWEVHMDGIIDCLIQVHKKYIV
jgi:IS30 family transposase